MDKTRRNPKTNTKTSHRLIDLMEVICFGRIEELVIREGEPVFSPEPRVFREVRFGRPHRQTADRDEKEFDIDKLHAELMGEFARIGNGVVECLEFKHGNPFRMTVRDAAVS